jgi:hypothetical protein
MLTPIFRVSFIPHPVPPKGGKKSETTAVKPWSFIILALFIMILGPSNTYPGIPSKLIYSSDSISGEWKDVVITGRNAKLVDEIDKTSEVKIDIPKDGYYKIYLHLYYKWQETCPKIDFIIKNADKKSTGSITLETNRIAPEMDGRWIFKTLEPNKPLYLKKGEAEISLTLKSTSSYWKQGSKISTAMGVIAIDYLIVQPVIFENGNFMSLDITEAESFKGEWDIKTFDYYERAGVLETTLKKGCSSSTLHIPFQSNFDIYALVKLSQNSAKKNNLRIAKIKDAAQQKTKLKVMLSNKKYNLIKEVELNNSNSGWQLLYVGELCLDKGGYCFSVTGDNFNENQIDIDYFIFSPI